MRRADETRCELARKKFKGAEGLPLFYGDWVSAAFVHFEVDPVILQREVPYKLDLRDGKAYVSLVAFTQRRLRPRLGAWITAAAFGPIAEHRFMNVRTYVAEDGERGIYFLREWVNNRLAVLLGPRSFGLPYRYAALDYCHDQNGARMIASHAAASSFALARKPSICARLWNARAAPSTSGSWNGTSRSRAAAKRHSSFASGTRRGLKFQRVYASMTTRCSAPNASGTQKHAHRRSAEILRVA